MNQNPIPLSQWEAQGNVWPTSAGWYNMLRPENQRDELLESGAVRRINGRWVIIPDKWQEYVLNHEEKPNGE
jgi:hypothetical protein